MNSGHLISLEANAMWMTKQLLMIVALSQAIAMAHADEANQTKPTQDPLKHPLSRIDYLSAGFFAQREKSIILEPPSTDKSDTPAIKASTSNANDTNGLHWVTNDQHPALEYGLSNDSTMRFHLGRHGAVMSLGLKF
jgi:hypothetical protein